MYVVPHGQEFQILSEHIDPAAIPKKYGGNHVYNWGDMPVLEPSIREKLRWENGFTDLPIGPIRWEQGSDGGMVAVAVGTKDEKRREVVVMKLGKNWRETFFRNDGEVSRDVDGGNGVGENQEKGDTARQVEEAKQAPNTDEQAPREQAQKVQQSEPAPRPAQTVPEQLVQQVQPVQQTPDVESDQEEEEFFPAQETLDTVPAVKEGQPIGQGGPPALAAVVN